MVAQERQITLPDGRSLAYIEFGDPTGSPVLFSHGFPGSGLEAKLLDAAARQVGVWLIAPDRPGFGRSDFQPDRTILDWPNDVACLANALDLEHFSLLGGSGGCPYVLATAHRLHQRVVRVAVIAGLGPTTEKHAVRRMGPVARLAFVLARRAPVVFGFAYGGLARLVSRYPALNFYLNKATRPDREVLKLPDVRSTLEASVRQAFRGGHRGPVHELSLLAGPWGFAPEQVLTRVDVWHGREDGVVPYAMGELLAKEIPNARWHILANEGHLSLAVRHGASILEPLS